mmetsp:Transcript_17857/g.42730  ORF Transcript_17857/g.42730 Transcript_17857/m.42730 type:complete len:557 (-) Transcript_17857:57-1727(-)
MMMVKARRGACTLSTITLLNTFIFASAFCPLKVPFLHRNPSFPINHNHLFLAPSSSPRLRSGPSAAQRTTNIRIGWNNRPHRSSILAVATPFGDFSRNFFKQAMSGQSSNKEESAQFINIAPFLSAMEDASNEAKTSSARREQTNAASNPPALIVCGPSGVGKGTLLQLLQKEMGNKVGFCVSHATRPPRAGEENGVHYWFVSEQEMREGIARGEYIEHQEVHGGLYGTSYKALEAVAVTGAVPLLDVDVRGAQALRDAGVQGQYVFIAPPSKDTLEARLRDRGTESEAAVLQRLRNANAEIEMASQEGLFDKVIVNEHLPSALAALSAALPLPAEPSGASASSEKAAAKPEVVFILGGPGSGKGTQSELLLSNFVASHLSAGELLRKALDDPSSAEAPLIDDCIKQGKIVPVEITCRLLQQEMEGQIAQGSSQAQARAPLFLIDGFPRNLDNFQGWEAVVGESVDIKFVLYFDCDQDVMLERLMERAKSSGRSDDNLDSINKRFKTFEQETLPVVRLLEEKGIVRHVDAQKQDVAGVYAQVKRIFLDEGLGRYQL